MNISGSSLATWWGERDPEKATESTKTTIEESTE
jgi:hypothetical protein